MSRQENRLFPSASDDVEVLCQDIGMRGCWFKCKVLHVNPSMNRMKVQRHDVVYVGGPDKLLGTIPIRVANPDRLSMRLNGRSTIRPWPQPNASEIEFELGKQVDVWWCDGWWVGVMIGQDQSANSKFKIYILGDNKFLSNYTVVVIMQ